VAVDAEVAVPLAGAAEDVVAADALARMADAPDGALDPARLRLLLGPTGELRAEIADDRCLLRARVVRAFPLSERQRYVAVLDASGKEACLIDDPDQVEPQTRALLDAALADYYRLNVVRRVYSYRSERLTTYWDVETDRGRRDFVVKWGADTVTSPRPRELLLVDIDGNRFHIPDLDALDEQSRRALRAMD
jgi:hypothetical protein